MRRPRARCSSFAAATAPSWQGAPSSAEWKAIADTTRRGYTGHEQIDNVMVVHMNGLALDPVIGRFEPANDSTYQFGTKPT